MKYHKKPPVVSQCGSPRIFKIPFRKRGYPRKMITLGQHVKAKRKILITGKMKGINQVINQ